MKSILITGSNGFIGKYFISHYNNKYNIKTFSFLKDDFGSLDLNSVDVVIHLSALVHQMGGARKDQYEMINIIQTIDLAKKAKNSGVKHFIFMSTIAVYGIEEGLIKENSVCTPLTEYGKSKLEAEQKLLELEDKNFQISIIRAPIVNGYNAPGNMRSLVSLVKRVSILPFKDIDNRRSMIYVGNLAYFIDAIIQKQVRGIFLVADKQSISTTKIIELISINLGKKVFLIKISFFEYFLQLLKPSYYKRLYGNLEIDNKETLKKLFGKSDLELPFCVEDGIEVMIHGENE